MTFNVLMVGVGGQGIILASDILAEVALLENLDVKKSEIHGMAQRGGSVESHIKFGENVYSPIISDYMADIIVSFEHMEFLRYMKKVTEKTILILNTVNIYPVTVSSGAAIYPVALINEHKTIFQKCLEIDALKIASELGNTKIISSIILGVLSTQLSLSAENWQFALRKMVPTRTADINLKAFERGRNIYSKHL